jgi:hypothetical protein
MDRRFVRRLVESGHLGLLVAVLLVTSCSKRKLVTDPGTGLAGVPSASQLIVYPDIPLRTYVFADTNQAVCVEDDSLLWTVDERLATPSTVHAMIFDYTSADAFQTFRQEGTDYQPLQDFLVGPTKRYPQGLTDVYTFTDPTAGPSLFNSYVGRGVVKGVVTGSSPLTNVGRVTVTPTASILYTAPTNLCGDGPLPGEIAPDSLLAMAWTPVPGAAGFWVQIYQFGTGADLLPSRFPAPAYVGRSIDYFLAYFPGTVNAYKIGDPLPPGARVLVRRTLLNGVDYAVRITAVNDQGQLIAYPSEASRAYFFIRDRNVETHYALRTLGAFVVHTGPFSDCPSTPPCNQAVGTQLPNVRIFHPDGLPPALR